MTDEQLVLQVVLDNSGHIADLNTTIESLDLDSLEFVELMLQVENAFSVKIPEVAMVRINKVLDILTEINAARLVQG